MQYTEILSAVKIEKQFIRKKMILDMDCGYTLGSPRRGGSNEYPQSMFWSKSKKNVLTPVYPSLVYKSGVDFPDGAIMIEMISVWQVPV